ncbi:MAG: sarcosine oxidase subunit gamma family protein [Gammaproteobacteria bacterium]
MSDYTIVKESPLGSAEHEFDGVTVCEVVDQSLVMIAMPNGEAEKIEAAIKKSCGLSLPAMGQSTQSSDSSITLWRLQKNQVLAYYAYESDDAEANIAERFNAPSAYYTDQSDTWAMIRVSGERSRDILERICPIDLDPSVFTLGSVSRTIMEHIGTIIYRDGDDSYVLLTMRSFGRSMMHAIEVSVENVL